MALVPLGTVPTLIEDEISSNTTPYARRQSEKMKKISLPITEHQNHLLCHKDSGKFVVNYCHYSNERASKKVDV